jgi:hypothetical protein
MNSVLKKKDFCSSNEFIYKIALPSIKVKYRFFIGALDVSYFKLQLWQNNRKKFLLTQ